MTDDVDYEDVLDNNVQDVKSKIRDMDDPNYLKLLQLEKEGKDRKTIKDFLEPKIEEEEEEVVEEIEEETGEGLLGAYTPTQVATGGLLIGIIIGLLIGMAGFTSTGGANPQMAKQTVSELLDATGFEGDMEFTEVTERNGMSFVQLNMSSTGPNGTVQTQQRSFYLSPDNELLFPEVRSALIQTPIKIQETLDRMEQQAAQTGNQTVNQTSQ